MPRNNPIHFLGCSGLRSVSAFESGYNTKPLSQGGLLRRQRPYPPGTRRWINVIDVDSTSQQCRVPSGYVARCRLAVSDWLSSLSLYSSGVPQNLSYDVKIAYIDQLNVCQHIINIHLDMIIVCPYRTIHNVHNIQIISMWHKIIRKICFFLQFQFAYISIGIKLNSNCFPEFTPTL